MLDTKSSLRLAARLNESHMQHACNLPDCSVLHDCCWHATISASEAVMYCSKQCCPGSLMRGDCLESQCRASDSALDKCQSNSSSHPLFFPPKVMRFVQNECERLLAVHFAGKKGRAQKLQPHRRPIAGDKAGQQTHGGPLSPCQYQPGPIASPTGPSKPHAPADHDPVTQPVHCISVQCYTLTDL